MIYMRSMTQFEAYNFCTHNGLFVSDTAMAVWCMDYIQKIISMPLDKLIESAEIDNLKY